MFNNKVVKQIKEHRIEIFSSLTATLGLLLVIISSNAQSAGLSYVMFSVSIFTFSFRRQYQKSWVRVAILFVLLSISGLGISFIFSFIFNENFLEIVITLMIVSIFTTLLLLFYLYLYVLRERYIHSYQKWEEETKRAADEYVAREKAKKEASKKWWEDDDIQRPFLKAQEEINLARIEVIESGKFVPEAIELYNKAQMEMMERNYAKAAALAKEARTRLNEEKAN
ncbi:MAG: hypothetical protein QXT63_05180 [Thermoplasmata archaeon]